jgi:hypothetical protein
MQAPGCVENSDIGCSRVPSITTALANFGDSFAGRPPDALGLDDRIYSSNTLAGGVGQEDWGILAAKAAVQDIRQAGPGKLAVNPSRTAELGPRIAAVPASQDSSVQDGEHSGLLADSPAAIAHVLAPGSQHDTLW